MHILPVLDLLQGVVVRGIAGRRSEYRPIVSRLTASCQPLDVARAFRDNFGLETLYLADLDALGGGPPAWETYRQLIAAGFRLWVDAGVAEPAQAEELAAAGVDTVILGLESLTGPEVLAAVTQCLRPDRLAFSLDLKDGQPLGAPAAWGPADARTIARQVVAAGINRLIVLDLARVGLGAGTGTEALCAQLAADFADLAILAGGGVRGLEDLLRLRQLGLAGALVASALHDGRLTRAMLAALSGPA